MIVICPVSESEQHLILTLNFVMQNIVTNCNLVAFWLQEVLLWLPFVTTCTSPPQVLHVLINDQVEKKGSYYYDMNYFTVAQVFFIKTNQLA